MDEFNIENLIAQYPSGSNRLGTEIESLKRKLCETDSNDVIQKPSKKCKYVEDCEYTCDKCGKVFSERQYLNRHMVSHEKLSCSSCSKTFTRLDNLERHEKRQREKEKRIKKRFLVGFSTSHLKPIKNGRITFHYDMQILPKSVLTVILVFLEKIT